MLVDVSQTFLDEISVRFDSDEEFNRLSNDVKCQQEICNYRVKLVLFQRTVETKSSWAD